MKKIVVSALVAGTMLMISGCSSDVTPESAAEEICEITKSGDLEAMAEVASFNFKQNFINLKKASPERYEKVLKDAKDGAKIGFDALDCSSITLREKSTNKYVMNVSGDKGQKGMIFTINPEKNTYEVQL